MGGGAGDSSSARCAAPRVRRRGRQVLASASPRAALGRPAGDEPPLMRRRPCRSDRKPLASIGLPKGSQKNMVHCSPGWPSKRTCGVSTKSMPEASSRCARCLPGGQLEHDAEVRHRHHHVADAAGARGGEGLAEVQRDLVAEEVEVDPGVGAAAFGAAEHAAIEAAGFVEVADVEGEVEDGHVSFCDYWVIVHKPGLHGECRMASGAQKRGSLGVSCPDKKPHSGARP